VSDFKLRAVIVRVTVGGKVVHTRAYGQSITGQPATTAMDFRNGAVAFTYLSTLLLELADRDEVGLSDKLSKWFPALPDSGRVTLRMLANMTAGYAD
jgi:CubicO group peptidase (beta-lactamase class C family)